MAPKQHGRRAADVKAKTPLTELGELLAANSGAFGRRAAVVAASGGLLTAAVLPAAGQGTDDEAKVAAESEKNTQVEFKNQTPNIDAGGSSDKGGQGIAIDTDVVTAEAAPKPKPKPEPEPEPEPTTVSEPAEEPAPEPADEPEPSETADDDSSDKSDEGSTDESPKKDTGGSDDSGNSDSEDSGSGAGSIDGSKAEQVLAWAAKGVGTPYVSGGTSPSGWDCSGYTQWVYSHVGVNLPRTSGAQKASGTVVSASEAKPGDLIWHPGHVGIYAGGGQMYDAGSPSSGTSKRSYSWMGNVTFIRVL